jgi:hypothetical protein
MFFFGRSKMPSSVAEAETSRIMTIMFGGNLFLLGAEKRNNQVGLANLKMEG